MPLKRQQRQTESVKRRPKRTVHVPLQQSAAASTVLSMRTPSEPRSSAVKAARRTAELAEPAGGRVRRPECLRREEFPGRRDG